MDSQIQSDTHPLSVDLDGTLLRSDLLVESALALLADRPWLACLFPIWLLQGKAILKREIAQRTSIPPTALPYDSRILELLKQAGRQGRYRVLCTASDRSLVEPIAAHLGCFEEVVASDGRTNLSGRVKAQALVDRFGERGFDYAGNDSVDLAVWSRARRALVVNANSRLARKAAKICEVEAHLPKESGGLKEWMKALRVHQWLKNLLVFIPLLAAHRLFEPVAAMTSLSALLAFSLCASGVYLLNDLLDLQVDRQHPRKRFRPFAAGRLSLLNGAMLAPALTLCGLGLAWLVSPSFLAVLTGYYALTLAYSLRLKRIPMFDVITLAGLYTIRIIGGTVAIGASLSFWLLAFSMFIFLSLAMLKRYTELLAMAEDGKEQVAGRGYTTADLSLVQSLGGASGFLAVLVLALYINSPESLALYAHPQMLWLLCPLMLFWISRSWLVAHRGNMHDDPVVFAVTDRTSQIVVALCGLVALGAVLQ